MSCKIPEQEHGWKLMEDFTKKDLIKLELRM